MRVFIKKKEKGFLIFQTALAMIVISMLSISLFTIYSGNFAMIKASRTALQAQQYAEIEADTLKLLSYDDLDATGAHARQAITSVAGADGWQDEITIADEQTYGADAQNKQRIATIKVYKDGDTLSRYSLQVPLSSKGSSGSKGLDWSKVVIYGRSASGTIPDNGVLFVLFGGSGHNTGSGVWINGVCALYMFDAYDGWVIQNTIVSKGDVWQWKDCGSGGLGNVYFVPFKK